MEIERSTALASDRAQVEAWIEEARGGSTAALGELLKACRPYLLALADRRISLQIKCKVSASDLVQETSLDAHRDFANFRGECLEELLAWLRKITVYNAANSRRHYQATGKRDASREIPLNGFDAIADQVRDDALSPRSLLVASEEGRIVECALARLPADYRTVILLRSREHLSFVEISAHMQRSADAVRKLWFRAVERLQEDLGTESDA